MRSSDQPLLRRSLNWPTERLPLPADVLAYMPEEWRRLSERSPRFARALAAETVWLAGGPPASTEDHP